jgi:hypothetical protein
LTNTSASLDEIPFFVREQDDTSMGRETLGSWRNHTG